MELTDGIIVLKPFEMSDAEKHLAGEDADQRKWLSGGRSTLQTVQDFIKRGQEYWAKNGPVFTLAVWAGGELIGMVEANTDESKVEGLEAGDANISYGLYPEARGKGYATRAVNLMAGFLKEKGHKRAVIRIEPDNVSSTKVPERCRFNGSGSIITKEGKELRVFVRDL